MKQFWNRYKRLLQKQFTDSFENNIRDIDYWRLRLFIQFMRYILPFGLIVYIPSMVMSIVADLPIVAIIDTTVLACFFLIALHKKISLLRKKQLLASSLYSLSVVLLLFLGSMGPGLIYLIATSVFIALVINKKAAYISVLINFCLYCLLGFGLLFPEIETHFFQDYTLGAWIAVGANFLLINLITVGAISLLLEGLQKTILKEKKLLIKLNEAKEKAIQSDKFKSAFLANMSHEIRTPLNAIIGFANLLSKNSKSSNHQQYVDIINSSSKQLLNLINDVIDLSKIEAGAIQVEIERINLNDFILGIIGSMKELCPKHLEFKYLIKDSDLNKVLGIDIQKATQIITNLITNAFKYTKEGHVEFKAWLSANNETIIFSIKDTGIGISEEQQEKVFQRFYQENALQSGVGLGLSICASLVKSLSGEIAMESKLGHGSTFTVKIPNNIKDEKEKLNQEKISDDAQNLPIRHGKRILIAEDDEHSYKIIKELLEKDQHIVTWTNNGNDTIIEAKNNKFDMVLIDLKMPVIDGYEATRKIRSFNKEISIVAVTANVFVEDKKRAIQAGCNDFLAKPIDCNKLKQLLAKYFN